MFCNLHFLLVLFFFTYFLISHPLSCHEHFILIRLCYINHFKRFLICFIISTTFVICEIEIYFDGMSEYLTSNETVNDKHKKYLKNLFMFNSQQISKNMLKNVEDVSPLKTVLQPPMKCSLYSSKFVKLSSRYAYLNNPATIRSRSLDFSDETTSSNQEAYNQTDSSLFDNEFKKTVNLQSLDLAHVEVLSHRKQKIGSKLPKQSKKGLDALDRKIIKSKLLSFDQDDISSKVQNSCGICKNKDEFDNSLRDSLSHEQKSDSISCSDSVSVSVEVESVANNLSCGFKNDDKTLAEDPSNNELTKQPSQCFDKSHSSNATNLPYIHPSSSEISSHPVVTSVPNILPSISESKCSYPVDNITSDFVTIPKQNNLSTPMPRLTCERRTHSVSHCMGLTRLSPPEPGPSRRHRHSISGQMSYLRMTGYGLMIQHQRRGGGSTNSLFSTAVISGSSSAPNLRDMIPNTASVTAAIEGCGGVPPIRPLETLHNALSLRQIDGFLDKMTRSIPLKHSTTALTQSVQSPNNSMGWSGPPSYVSSSGPSSPNGLSDFIRGIGNSDSSDFSIISNDGFPKIGAMSGQGRDDRESDIDVEECYAGHRDSLEIIELLNWNQQQTDDSMHFSPINPADHGDSGDVTPVSVEFTNEFTGIASVEDDDEEKTLTAFTKDEMSRPKLAEIKWSQDECEAVGTRPGPAESNPKRFAFGRFECYNTLSESDPNKKPQGSSNPSHSESRTGHIADSECEPIFEMETDCEPRHSEPANSDDESKGFMNLPHISGRRYSDQSTRNVSPCSLNDSPVVTFAGNLKAHNIARGFVIPKGNGKAD